MNWIQLTGSLELGLLYGLVAFGVYLSFRTLQFPDLTVDGSFPLGASVCAALMTAGVHPGLATVAALLAGGLAGWVTAWLSTSLGMLNLLAGILTMTALYSLNLRIMGRPNLALFGEKPLVPDCFSALSPVVSANLLFLLLLTFLVGILLYLFLQTHLGLAVRATGSNPRMGRAQGISDQKMICLGLSLSNALVAFSGALFAQLYGFADVNMGIGTIVIGLATVILGEAVLATTSVLRALVACVLGAILYRLVIALALHTDVFGLHASDVNLVTALLVVGALGFPAFKRRVKSLV